MTDGGGAYHQRAVGYGFRHCLEDLRRFQSSRSTNSRTSVSKCYVVRVHQPQMRKSEITHGPRSRAYVEGIAHVHEDDAQIGEFGGNSQAIAILRHEIWNGLQAD